MSIWPVTVLFRSQAVKNMLRVSISIGGVDWVVAAQFNQAIYMTWINNSTRNRHHSPC